jgi:hypothetical protein
MAAEGVVDVVCSTGAGAASPGVVAGASSGTALVPPVALPEFGVATGGMVDDVAIADDRRAAFSGAASAPIPPAGSAAGALRSAWGGGTALRASSVSVQPPRMSGTMSVVMETRVLSDSLRDELSGDT